jgi:hypothetical protein
MGVTNFDADIFGRIRRRSGIPVPGIPFWRERGSKK